MISARFGIRHLLPCGLLLLGFILPQYVNAQEVDRERLIETINAELPSRVGPFRQQAVGGRTTLPQGLEQTQAAAFLRNVVREYVGVPLDAGKIDQVVTTVLATVDLLLDDSYYYDAAEDGSSEVPGAALDLGGSPQTARFHLPRHQAVARLLWGVAYVVDNGLANRLGIFPLSSPTVENDYKQLASQVAQRIASRLSRSVDSLVAFAASDALRAMEHSAQDTITLLNDGLEMVQAYGESNPDLQGDEGFQALIQHHHQHAAICSVLEFIYDDSRGHVPREEAARTFVALAQLLANPWWEDSAQHSVHWRSSDVITVAAKEARYMVAPTVLLAFEEVDLRAVLTEGQQELAYRTDSESHDPPTTGIGNRARALGEHIAGLFRSLAADEQVVQHLDELLAEDAASLRDRLDENRAAPPRELSAEGMLAYLDKWNDSLSPGEKRSFKNNLAEMCASALLRMLETPVQSEDLFALSASTWGEIPRLGRHVQLNIQEGVGYLTDGSQDKQDTLQALRDIEAHERQRVRASSTQKD